MKKRKTKKHTIYTLLGKIGDIILIPIVIIALIVTMLIFFQNTQKTMPSFFGVSVVRILSGSMVKSGFYKNDNVLIIKTDTNKLWGDYNAGDIIAFYSYSDSVDKNFQKTKLESIDQIIEITKEEPENRKSVKDLNNKGYKVVFHQIVGVYQDETGARYFETKGTSNASKDPYLIRDDFVLGKYLNTPSWVRSTLNWITSPMGMIFLVCLPLGVLVILEALALIEQVNFLYIERKLMKGEMHWQDQEAQRLIKTGDMEKMCKIIYLTVVENEELDEVIDAIWVFPEKLNKTDSQNKANAEQGFKILKTQGKEKYLLFWKDKLKWNVDKKLIDEEIAKLTYKQLKNEEQ